MQKSIETVNFEIYIDLIFTNEAFLCIPHWIIARINFRPIGETSFIEGWVYKTDQMWIAQWYPTF